jgi:uncharacterized protein (TIGR03435 family)
MTAFRIILFFMSFIAGAVLAQTPDILGNRFFRVTITENDKPLLARAMFEDTAGHFIVKGAPLADVIAFAYDIETWQRYGTYQVVDAPAWVYESHLYDVEGEPPPPELVASSNKLMLQAMLADRFKLQVRRETRDVNMLVLAATDATKPPVEVETARRVRIIPGERSGGNLTTRALITELTRRLGEPVHDLTGLFQFYMTDFNLPDNDLAALSKALLEQAGLILEERTIPLDVVVVTRVERPVLDPVDR